LILRKIFKTVATRRQIFRLKYTKFVVGRRGGEVGEERKEKGEEGREGEERDPPGKILATGLILSLNV